MDLQELLAEIRSLKAEQQTANETRAAEINEQMDAVKAEIAEINERQAKMERPTAANDSVDTRHTDAVMSYVRTGEVEEVRQYLDGETDADGGYLLSPDLADRILAEAYNANELKDHVYMGTTGRSEVFLPHLSQAKTSWGNVTLTEQDLQTGGKTLKVQNIRALVPIHEDTLADTQYSLEDKLVQMFGAAIAETEALGWSIGAGSASKQPLGFAADADVQARAIETSAVGSLGSSANVIRTLINNAMYSLKKTYRKNAKLAMNSNTEAVLASTFDSKDKSLITFRDGKSYFDNRFEIVTVEDMDEIGDGAFPIVVGDFKHYEVYKRSGVSIKRLTDSKYSENELVGFLVKVREAGGVTQPEAFTPIQVKAA